MAGGAVAPLAVVFEGKVLPNCSAESHLVGRASTTAQKGTGRRLRFRFVVGGAIWLQKLRQQARDFLLKGPSGIAPAAIRKGQRRPE